MITIQVSSQSSIFIFDWDENDCPQEVVSVDSTDSTALLRYEIAELKQRAWIILSMGLFSHSMSSMAFFDADSPDGFDHGIFIVHTVTAVSLDIVAIINFCQARKKVKQLKKILGEN